MGRSETEVEGSSIVVIHWKGRAHLTDEENGKIIAAQSETIAALDKEVTELRLWKRRVQRAAETESD